LYGSRVFISYHISGVSAMEIQEKYMKEALKQARKAYKLGEVPIGCVIVYGDKIIARGYNRRKTAKNTLSHAELQAIRKASRVMGDWWLNCGICSRFRIEPAQPALGFVQARIPRVVIGCMNPKAGCAGSILNLLQMPQFNHQVEIVRGVMEEECSSVLKTFFKELRVKVKEEKAARKAIESEGKPAESTEMETEKPDRATNKKI